MKTYTCFLCHKVFKRYPSQVRDPQKVFCSQVCRNKELSISSKGENNPNYKTGIHSTPSLCQCGNPKDYRAKQCALCAHVGLGKDADLSTEEIEIIKDVIHHSKHYSDAAKHLQVHRNWVRKFVEIFNVDVSHFVAGRRRPYKGTDYLKKSSKRDGTIRSIILREKLIPYQCSICGQEPFWNNRILTLQLHHISGDSTDNSLENLIFLCPNCHTQTETYCGRNEKCRSKKRR